MSWTFVACVGIAFAWMGLFYLWGRAFLIAIKAEPDVASGIAFGYLVLQVIYQIIYLPFYLSRGSYRATVYIWLGIVGIASLGIIVYLRNHRSGKRIELKAAEKAKICGAVVLILGLAFYISLHVPFYGQDTVTYISTMNDAYYRDTIWISSGVFSLHHGLCSLFHFFTVSSFITGIRPYYISLFTVRIIGVCLFALIMYRMGVIIFCKTEKKNCWPAIALSIITPMLLMVWGSNYTAEFFYWRINEAKGYCQFILLPLGFSVFLSMFKERESRKPLWKEQLLVGLAAIAVSSSSLTSYIFLVLMGVVALLAYDKGNKIMETIGRAIICVLPNMLYLILYILEQKNIIFL